MIDEMHCPLCGQPVRSDAALRRVCNLCGMGIPPGDDVFTVEVKGLRLTFCSHDCLVAHRSMSASKE
ncbi:MAG: hypothetical protein ACE5IB_02330 [Candidatus Geothermarchaeales archaeon]